MLAACGSIAPGQPAPADGAPAGATFALDDGLSATIVQDGLEVPWDLDFTPDGRMLVTERPGRVNVFASGEPGAEKLSAYEIPGAYAEGEAGAMGIAVDSDFERFPHAYVCVSRDPDGPDGEAAWRNALLRFTVKEDGTLTEDPTPVLDGMVAAFHHNGCAVQMDDTGHIWLTMGDANRVRAQHDSQRLASLNGKVVRLNRDGSTPDDNPVFEGTDAPTLVYSMGHRNPQGIAMRSDGLIMEAEHGTDRDDEINHIVPGGNYGYGCYTAADALGPAQEQEGEAKELCQGAEAYLPPAWASGIPTIATSGAIFLEGEEWGDWDGMLLVSTLKEGDLRLFRVVDDGDSLEEVAILADDQFGRLRGMVIGPDGALYLTTAEGTYDKVIRLVRDAV